MFNFLRNSHTVFHSEAQASGRLHRQGSSPWIFTGREGDSPLAGWSQLVTNHL